MRSKPRSSHMLLLAAAASMLMTTGCVFVVGGNGKTHGGEVEWSTSRSSATPMQAPVSDSRLAREVEARLKIDTALGGEDITVSSRGDVVTLHGRVSAVTLLEHAMRVAADVPGVSRVISRVTVEMEAG
jgi:hypothetical protein